MVLVLTISLVACDGNSDLTTSEQKENNTNQSEEAVQNGTELKVSEGKYIIGDYIKEAQYIITCEEDSYMNVIVFENEKNFNDYDSADRFTNGEEREAIERYALYDTYLEDSKSAFLSLKSGYVLYVYIGNGGLNKISLDTFIQNKSDIYAGIYFIRDDIKEGQYSLTCTNPDYSGMNLVVFESKENYMGYFKSSRFTNGEENDAIDANAKESKYISQDNSYSVYLREGNILMLDGGSGILEMLD